MIMENLDFERFRKKRDNVKYWGGKYIELFENGLYDDGRWNSEGKFGIGKKRYWNKVSGKWVGKKNECYRSKKIWFYEFDYINEKFIVELFKDNNNEYRSFRNIDRVGYFISLIYVIGSSWRSFDEWEGGKRGVYISKSEVIGVLGSDEKKIIKRLVDLDIIKKWKVGVNKNDSGKDVVNYSLNEELLGNIVGKKWVENKSLESFVIKNLEGKDIDWVEIEYIKRIKLDIEENKLKEIIDKKYNDKISEIKLELEWGDQFISKEDKVKKINFINGNKEKYIKKINNRYKIFIDIVDEVKNGFINKRLFFRDNHSGRYYNVVNSLDKEFRKELLLDGEKVVEIDMKSMYVSCLMYMFERINIVRSGLYKMKEIENKKIIRDYLKYFSKKDKERNKLSNGFEWLDDNKEIYSEEVIGFDIKDKRWKNDWSERKKLWSWYFDLDKKYYDWGKVNGVSVDKKIKNIRSDEDYLEFVNEFRNVWEYSDRWEKIDDDKKEDEIFKEYKVNGKLLSFKRSDNLIKYVVEYIDSENSKKGYREQNIENKFFIGFSKYEDGRIIKGKDWLGNNYEEFKNISGRELENTFGKLEDEDYKILFGGKKIIRKLIKVNDDGETEWDIRDIDYKIKVGKYISDKLNKKWKFNKKYRLDFNNDYNEFKESVGKDYYLKFDRKVEIDYSEDLDFYVDDFLNKMKGVVFDSEGKIDFYNYLKVMFSWNYKDTKNVGGYKDLNGVYIDYNYDLKDWGNNKIFNRNFYKMLVMRVLFSKGYLVNNIKSLKNDKIGNSIFSDKGYELIWRIKNYNMDKNEYGELLKNKDRIDSYKNLSKILGVVEVDVIEYLVNNYFRKMNKEYIRIFDGFMIKEKDYWENKFYLNMILKNDVGYMFDIR